ncbi:uncharacterized protein CYBJADRAFT_166936, partial [Cyberlindnera jadinii NRRL Y-1542]
QRCPIRSGPKFFILPCVFPFLAVFLAWKLPWKLPWNPLYIRWAGFAEVRNQHVERTGSVKDLG